MFQAISTDVFSIMSVSTQATPPPPGQGGGGRGNMGGQGGSHKKVAFTGNFNRCGKAVHYVRDCPDRNTYWDQTPAGTEDTDTKVRCKKGDKSDITMSYCSVCKRWDYHNAPGHSACQATQVGASGTGSHAATSVAAVGGGEDSYDDFIPFIG